jgi:hypothetical protein
MKSIGARLLLSCCALSLACGGNAFSAGSGGTTSSSTGGTPSNGGNAGSVPDPGNNGGSGGSFGSGGIGAGLGGIANLPGGGPAIPCESNTDCDDANPCTNDSCGSNGFCTIRPNSDPCGSDDNDCTEDKCAGGICIHPATTDPCGDDGDECTNDVCNGGFCTHPSTGMCDCNGAGDCDDSNPCTDDSCDGSGQCQYADNSDPCGDDNNECTDDLCSGGSCMHENNTVDCTDDGIECTEDVCAQGVCTHPEDPTNQCPVVVKILANTLVMDQLRTFVALENQGYLVTGANPDQAELFEVITVEGTKIKLRAMSTGHFVGIDLNNNDYLIANASSLETATEFDDLACADANEAGAACAPNCRSLEALDDDELDNVVSAEPTCPASGGCVPLGIRARSTICEGSATSWEAWEFIYQ